MHTNIDKIRMVVIEEVIQETPSVKTFVFDDVLSSHAKPGQFLMIWIPRAEELPMSVMISNKKNHAAITIRKHGFGSTSLFEKKQNDLIGVRGPYGNYFSISKDVKRPLLVGGGTGLVPLLRLAGSLNSARIDTTLIIGARTHPEVFFEELALKSLSDTTHHVVVTTEDGSYGIRGQTTDAMLNLINTERFDTVYTCGPEGMMKKVFELARKKSIPIQASLERYMKCGIGICASCCIGDRLVCKDGTIFNGKDLSSLSEFGHEYRDKSGCRCRYI